MTAADATVRAAPAADRTPWMHLRLLTIDDLAPATEVLAEGFAEEPGNVALFPDPKVRRAIWTIGARRALTDAIPFGTAHATFVAGELAAVALWDPPGRHRRGTGVGRGGRGERLRQVPAVAPGLPHAVRVARSHARDMLELSRERRRTIATLTRSPTWHLAFLATVPAHRGRGLARTLLERQLTRCDQDQLPIWLETTDPVNPPIYERFGFETILHLEDAAWFPGCWVMRRAPLPAGR